MAGIHFQAGEWGHLSPPAQRPVLLIKEAFPVGTAASPTLHWHLLVNCGPWAGDGGPLTHILYSPIYLGVQLQYTGILAFCMEVREATLCVRSRALWQSLLPLTCTCSMRN
jgi:hypothetical protein